MELNADLLLNLARSGDIERLIDHFGRNRTSEKLFDDLKLYLNHPNAERYRDACKHCCVAILEIGLEMASKEFDDKIYKIRRKYYQEIIYDLNTVCEYIHIGEGYKTVPLIKKYRHDLTRAEIVTWLITNVNRTMDTQALMKKCGTYMDPDMEGQRLGFPYTR